VGMNFDWLNNKNILFLLKNILKGSAISGNIWYNYNVLVEN
jgi:hypothetical protein